MLQKPYATSLSSPILLTHAFSLKSNLNLPVSVLTNVISTDINGKKKDQLCSTLYLDTEDTSVFFFLNPIYNHLSLTLC